MFLLQPQLLLGSRKKDSAPVVEGAVSKNSEEKDDDTDRTASRLLKDRRIVHAIVAVVVKIEPLSLLLFPKISIDNNKNNDNEQITTDDSGAIELQDLPR